MTDNASAIERDPVENWLEDESGSNSVKDKLDWLLNCSQTFRDLWRQTKEFRNHEYSSWWTSNSVLLGVYATLLKLLQDENSALLKSEKYIHLILTALVVIGFVSCCKFVAALINYSKAQAPLRRKYRRFYKLYYELLNSFKKEDAELYRREYNSELLFPPLFGEYNENKKKDDRKSFTWKNWETNVLLFFVAIIILLWIFLGCLAWKV